MVQIRQSVRLEVPKRIVAIQIFRAMRSVGAKQLRVFMLGDTNRLIRPTQYSSYVFGVYRLCPYSTLGPTLPIFYPTEGLVDLISNQKFVFCPEIQTRHLTGTKLEPSQTTTWPCSQWYVNTISFERHATKNGNLTYRLFLDDLNTKFLVFIRQVVCLYISKWIVVIFRAMRSEIWNFVYGLVLC